jgi:branched-chain amino acid transport system ATP-binding protein
MLEATGLMVFYENMLALNNINIKCSADQIVGVFGANSAGKSTLMYTLSGIMEDIRNGRRRAGHHCWGNQIPGGVDFRPQTKPAG